MDHVDVDRRGEDCPTSVFQWTHKPGGLYARQQQKVHMQNESWDLDGWSDFPPINK
jgi:hypothetical protein